MKPGEVNLLAEHMAQTVPTLELAGLIPPFEVVQSVARQQPGLC